MSPLLRIVTLRKRVAGRLLLDLEDLVIPAGACTVLTGRNGAGKTTLLKLLAGLLPADSAELIYQGQRLSGPRARRLLRQEAVYLHQHPYLFDGSVFANVAYGLRRAGVPRAQVRERVDAALRWAGLTHLAERHARTLSGGEKQRVALVRARVLAPRLLLLDEPTANLDRDAREQAYTLVRRLSEEGIATVVTSHDPEVAERLGDQHVHLCQTGPCRSTIVRPFLYNRDLDERIETEMRLRPPVEVPRAGGDHRSPSPSPSAREQVTAVILAGGRARRMGGEDKGLLPLGGRPMVAYVLQALQPQVGAILVNANRNLEAYAALGCPVVPDRMGDFYGPLVGMASALERATTRYLLTVPCDSPLVPADLAETLLEALQREGAELSVAHDGERMQPVFALLDRALLPSLLAYLEAGGRKIDAWYAQHRVALADFSGQKEAFLNVNTPEERSELERRLSR